MVRHWVGAWTLVAFLPLGAVAQERPWIAEGTFGYAGIVDEATDNYAVIAGGLRRFLSPRISVGPEFVFMKSSSGLRDLVLMATGNFTVDVPPPGSGGLTPFITGGFGLFSGREQFPAGPFWSSEPAFTAGGGIRAAIGERATISGEYRLGWELHHRVTTTVGWRW